VPPLIHLAAGAHLKLMGIKALLARLRDCSRWLVIPSLKMSKEIIKLALSQPPEIGAGSLGLSVPLIYESAHPYDHNKDEYIFVSIKGATKLILTFDAMCATESGCDYVKLYKDTSKTECWGAAQYTGGKDGGECNWPCQGGRPPLIIPASSFYLYFHSDGSVNAWGWKITVQGQMRNTEDLELCAPALMDNARCALQALGEGPAMVPLPEGLDDFPVALREKEVSAAQAMMDKIVSEGSVAGLAAEASKLELKKSVPGASDSVSEASPLVFPCNFVLNASEGSELAIYQQPKAEGSAVRVEVTSVLVASAEKEDWLEVRIDSDPPVTGWVRRRNADSILLTPQQGRESMIILNDGPAIPGETATPPSGTPKDDEILHPM